MTAIVNRTGTTGAGLGPLLSEHTVTKSRQYGNLVGGLIAVGLGLAALVIGMLAASADPRYITVCGGNKDHNPPLPPARCQWQGANPAV